MSEKLFSLVELRVCIANSSDKAAEAGELKIEKLLLDIECEVIRCIVAEDVKTLAKSS